MHRPAEEPDLLITRIIDGEATDADRKRFDELSGAEPALWRRLALRQQDMTKLAAEVREATARAIRISLPRRWLLPDRMSWTIALSGWAAVLILALTWWAIVLGPMSMSRAGAPQAVAILTPEEHFTSYLAAPYVLGDLKPHILQIEPLSDGRVALHFVRRIEEVAFLDPTTDLPVDGDGELTRDLGRLRASEPDVGLDGVSSAP